MLYTEPSVIGLDDIEFLDIGNTIQLGGGIWTGNGHVYLIPFPDEDLKGTTYRMDLNTGQWERFLNQTDVLDIRGPNKAVLRKSQRIIDQWIAWKVFKRDGYRCRYCGKEAPLTVDHVILWENGGATVEDNLVSACRKCNKTRGSMAYDDWLNSTEYAALSSGLNDIDRYQNTRLVGRLDELRKIKAKPRSR